MFANGLFLNDCKSEFIIIGIRQQCAKVKLRNIMIGQSSINSKVLVRNLGVWFDTNLAHTYH